MRNIYHANTKAIMANESLSDLLKALPEECRERALRYRFERDSYNFVAGRLLLQKGLQELGLSSDLSQLTYQQNGKPQLPGLHFNISHSDHLVVCVLSTDGEVGIDVELQGQIELGNFIDYFTELEWNDITHASDSIKRFYFYWTRKEAVIKALGVSLSWLHQIELDATGERFVANGREWVLEEVELDWGIPQPVYCVLCY
jgi:4'-phosphopantetheinyl transferase